MAQATNVTPQTETTKARFSDVKYSPLDLVLNFLNGIVASNRFAREVETCSRASDAKLARMGMTRDTIVPSVAERVHLFKVV